jgi:hypothetical protein
MTIHHVDSQCTYLLYEMKGNFFIESGSFKSLHPNNDVRAAIWSLIDWMRMVCFTNLTDGDCEKIKIISNSTTALHKDDVMNIICGRKLNRVFYEQAYTLIHDAYSQDVKQTISLHNGDNFFLYEEILQLLRFSPEKKLT